jgi:hypothetical protein
MFPDWWLNHVKMALNKARIYVRNKAFLGHINTPHEPRLSMRPDSWLNHNKPKFEKTRFLNEDVF